MTIQYKCVSFSESELNLYTLLIRIVFICLCWLAFVVKADIVTGLYDAAIDIPEQSAKAQNAAIKMGFKEVLVKISGVQEIVNEPALKPYLQQANQFIRQFQFDTKDGQLSLVTSFDPAKIDDLIQQLGYPIWGSYRPASILWVAQEGDDFQRKVLSENTSTTLKQQIASNTNKRGLSVIYPVLDLDDLQKVGLYDVWGFFTDNILSASQRYGVEAVYTARVYPEQKLDSGFIESNPLLGGREVTSDELDGNETTNNSDKSIDSAPVETLTGDTNLQADWFLFVQGEQSTGTFVASSEQELAVQLVNNLANELAKRYAVTQQRDAALDTQVAVAINNINSIADYIKAKQYFESLRIINAATLVSLSGSEAKFELALKGQVQDVLSVFQLDDKIQRQQDSFGRPTADLAFTWNP